MDNLSMRLIYDRKKEATATNPASVLIEVREKGTSNKIYINTGVSVTTKQYSDTNGFTCKNHPNADGLTKKAHRVFREVESFILSDKCTSLKSVKNYNKEESSNVFVVDFIKEDLRLRNPSYEVLEYNNSFLKRLTEFGKINTFSDITYNNIELFDAYLRKFIKSQPTLYKRHSLFKGYLEKARKRGLITYNPYDDFKVNKGKSREPIFLTQEEVQAIMNESFDGPLKSRLEKTRDLFIFQCFTGYAYADLSKFTKYDVVTINGTKELRNNRQKTGEDFVILFLPQAKAIAEKYNYELPKISNQKYNDYLKLIASQCGINKPITSHTARHTFAIYLIEKEMPIEMISRILGHSNIKQTQHYARLRAKTVIEKMKERLL